MKALRVISTTALFLLFGATVPVFAQDNHEQEAKPEQQDQAKPAQHEEQAKPAKKEEQAKAPKQEEQAKSEKQATEAKPVKQEEQAKAPKQVEQAKFEKQAPEAKPAKHEQVASSQRPQRSQQAEAKQRAMPALRLSARGSGRIPDDRFQANFGQGHTFIINQPEIVGGYSRFQYSGFWFGFVDPWPVDWYYTDDVYVVFVDGGYYLCNPYYPGVQIGISVVI